jgi:hypothetical protein
MSVVAYSRKKENGNQQKATPEKSLVQFRQFSYSKEK